MAVDNKDVVAHTGVEGYFGNYVHAGVAKLERYHGEVRFRAFEEAFTATKLLHRRYVLICDVSKKCCGSLNVFIVKMQRTFFFFF